MNGSVLRIGTTIVFRFGHSPHLQASLEAASGHRVRWDRELHGYTLPVSDLRHNPPLRAAVRDFINENGFEADAAVLLLLFAPRGSSNGLWEPGAVYRPWKLRSPTPVSDLQEQMHGPFCDGAGDGRGDCAACYGTPDGRHRAPVRRAAPTAASGADQQAGRLDRWESALRRMHDVIDALDTVLRRVGQMRIVQVMMFLAVSVLLTWYQGW